MRVSVRRIQEIVARHYSLSPDDLTSSSRVRRITGPRQQAMYLSTQLTGLSLPVIGGLFGGKDHTTVLHARRVVEQRLSEQPKLAKLIAKFAEKTRQFDAPIPGAWPENELKILRSVYPKKGAKGVCRILTNRSLQAVWAKARKTGLRFERGAHVLVNFPRECKQCGTPLHYSKSAKYLNREPTGLCRPCCNRRPRSEETLRKVIESTRIAQSSPEYKRRWREAHAKAMANLSPEERARRRENARLLGLSQKGNKHNPPGSPCRILASQKAAETRRRKAELARLAELRRPKTFEEKLQLVMEGKANVIPAFKMPSNDPEFTLGGVSAGMVA